MNLAIVLVVTSTTTIKSPRLSGKWCFLWTSDITVDKITRVLSQMWNSRALGEDGIRKEIIQLGGTVTLKSMSIFMNKNHNSKISKNWQIARVILLFKKGDKLNISNYHPVSLLSHPSLIQISYSQKFDDYQPWEQAGFRKGCSTIEQVQNIKTLIEKCRIGIMIGLIWPSSITARHSILLSCELYFMVWITRVRIKVQESVEKYL